MSDFLTALIDSCVEQHKAKEALGHRGVICMKAHPLSRLLAAVPYIAGCPDPLGSARANLKALFDERIDHTHPHKSGMSLRGRFQPHDIAPGAHRADVVEKAWLILELISLQDHQADRDKDRSIKKANPLNDGELVFDVELKRLRDGLAKLGRTEIDDVVSIDEIIRDNAIWFC